MTPSKKSDKKAAKKTAKKAGGHPRGKHHNGHDLRRAYEHMGRVAVLQTTKSSMSDAVAELTALAQRAIKDGHSNDAADLLRAAEHLSFAALAEGISDSIRISPELKQTIAEHFDELTRRADKHWSEEAAPSILTGIYQTSRDNAAAAFKARAYHQAFEYVRAAEVLAHVHHRGPLGLERGHKSLQLKSS